MENRQAIASTMTEGLGRMTVAGEMVRLDGQIPP